MKGSAFDMQFHFIVVSIFLKSCVKDHGDRKKDLISMYRVSLVSSFVNISVYLNKLAFNFKPLHTFFFKLKILEINRPFI